MKGWCPRPLDERDRGAKNEDYSFLFWLLGGGKRDRTADPLNAIQVLSQLSYTPDYCYQNHTVGLFLELVSQFKEGAILKRGGALVNGFLINKIVFYILLAWLIRLFY